jgi:hypothetical protein
LTLAVVLASALIDAERQSVFDLLCFLDCRMFWWPAATTLSIERAPGGCTSR